MNESSIQLPASSIQFRASSFELPASSIQLHIARTGGGFPLIAIHGRTGNGAMWTRTARLLAPHYHVVMSDLRGHGLSDAPDSGYDQVTMTHDIFSMMEAMGIQRAVLMGGSMGAALATRIAAEYPDYVEKLVLHLTCWTSDAQLAPDYLRNKIERKRAQFGVWNATPLSKLIDQVRVFSDGWADEDIERAAKSWQQVSENAAQTFTHDLTEAEWHALAKRVRCPILALMGHKEPGHAATRAFCENELPNCTFVHLRGGHTAMYEDFETYAKHLSAFLGTRD